VRPAWLAPEVGSGWRCVIGFRVSLLGLWMPNRGFGSISLCRSIASSGCASCCSVATCCIWERLWYLSSLRSSSQKLFPASRVVALCLLRRLQLQSLRPDSLIASCSNLWWRVESWPNQWSTLRALHLLISNYPESYPPWTGAPK